MQTYIYIYIYLSVPLRFSPKLSRLSLCFSLSVSLSLNSLPLFLATMECPACGQCRSKAQWSPLQWRHWSPIVQDYDRNCCRVCSPTCFQSEPQPKRAKTSPPPRPSQETRALFQSILQTCESWLRSKVPSHFWILTHARWCAANQNAVQLQRLREILCPGVQSSYRKILSYFGAVRIPTSYKDLVPPGDIGWIEHGDVFVDPSNAIYSSVFLRIWSAAATTLGLTNKETIGDFIEALLGYSYLVNHVRQPISVDAIDVVAMLEKACFAEYVLASRLWA